MTHTSVASPTWNLLADLHDILSYGFMQNAAIAGTLVAVLAGIVGYFVVLRRLAFATEALAHGGFAGATGAVVLRADVFLGLLVFTSCAGLVMGLLGDRLRGRDVAIGATLALSLALGSVFLTLSTRLAGEAVNILFGNILAISSTDIVFVIVFGCLMLLAIGAMFRPLLFASVDPEIAAARGLPVRAIGIAFMLVLGFTVAAAVQVVGVLLIFSLLVLPAAAAQHLTARPSQALVYAVAIAVLCVWVGLFIGFYAPLPPSFFITALAFLTFVGSRGWLSFRRHGQSGPRVLWRTRHVGGDSLDQREVQPGRRGGHGRRRQREGF